MRKANQYVTTELKEFKSKIGKLFSEIRKQKIYAKQNFMCCTNCSWYAFADLDPYDNGKFVFTIKQHRDMWKQGHQVIYGSYPKNIYELIKKVGLDYKQETENAPIILLHNFGKLPE